MGARGADIKIQTPTYPGTIPGPFAFIGGVYKTESPVLAVLDGYERAGGGAVALCQTISDVGMLP